MSSESRPPGPANDGEQDSRPPLPYEARVTSVRDAVTGDGTVQRVYTYRCEPEAPPFVFEHDKEKRLFILKWPDGTIERFRDSPARHLMVEPDPDTGKVRPVVKRGRPAYAYFCREEREIF